MSQARDTAWGPWLALRMVRGVGSVVYRSLLRELGDPAAVLAAGARRLEAVGVRPEVARAIAAFDGWEAVESQLRRLERSRARLLTWVDESYPASLQEIHDPPPFLFLFGDLLPEDQVAVAVVGSRSPSPYGRQMTRALCAGLARLGITVVSGLARGIDAEAHQATLRGGGRTIAILGSGIDVVYPGEHHGLFRAIAQNGAVMTEYLMGVTPEAENFPSRNRIISGLSLGTLVVEATERSGSLITAQYALEQGREVFAVPGPVGARSRGPHQLIKQGAKLSERVEDVVEEIAPQLLPRVRRADLPLAEPTELERQVLEQLSEEPTHVDSIIGRSGLAAPQILGALSSLEVKGWVRQQPGKLFAAVELPRDRPSALRQAPEVR